MFLIHCHCCDFVPPPVCSGSCLFDASAARCSLEPLCIVDVVGYGINLNGCVHVLQILNGGAPCQQIDSEEEDEQEAEADDEVSWSHGDFACPVTASGIAPAVLCCAVLCRAMPCCAMLCHHVICTLLLHGLAVKPGLRCALPFTFSSLAGNNHLQRISLDA